MLSKLSRLRQLTAGRPHSAPVFSSSRGGAAAALAGLVCALTAACSGAGDIPAAGGDLLAAVAGERFAAVPGAAALHFDRLPAAAAVTLDGERRQAVVVGTGRWSWRLRVPPRGRLRGAVQLVPGSVAAGGVQTSVTVSSAGTEEVLEVIRLPGAGDAATAAWVGLDLDLAPWSGRQVVLGFDTAAWGGVSDTARLAWAALRVVPDLLPDSGVEAPPSILLIVADTLRRDRVSAYAEAGATTPEIRRRLAEPGLVFDRAYAQAPWTAPSVASYLTGRHPEWALAPGGGIAAGLPTLAEVLRDQGYRTAAFVANPMLGDPGAYDRGFDSFFATTIEDGWTGIRADELTARAAGWLVAHRGERTFVYLHYVDPHSPYDSPYHDRGASADAAAEPAVEDLRWGRAEMSDPDRDAERIASRYNDEVRYLDASVGGLLASLETAPGPAPLIVFASDHGEELLDHGWWGHGRTLYDELIRVPLIMRWDGHLPTGGRVEGTVRLLDLLPTLATAAGAPTPEGVAGVDLWSRLAAGRAPPRLTGVAQHHYLGPLRAAAVGDGLKLILFNREAPASDDHPQLAFAVELDRRLLSRIEVYDLDHDPGERHDLAGSLSWTGGLAALETAIHNHLQGQLSGLRVIASGVPAGARLRARFRCSPPPQELQPYFLAAADRAVVADDELHLELTVDPISKGVVVGSGCERVEAIEAAIEPMPDAALRLRTAGRPWPGGSVGRDELTTAAAWPVAAAGPVVDLWYAAGSTPLTPPAAGDHEALGPLRALGYLAGASHRPAAEPSAGAADERPRR